jgi:5S rRNA maturation endonuclease (ribonuclease M5)
MTAREYVELRQARGARVQPLHDGWLVTCPAHDDRTPSLHVSEGDDGRVLLSCHASCEFADVVAADGLDVTDLFNGSRTDRAEVAVYRYVDEHDEPLFEVVRFHPKDFRQRRPDGIWGIRGVRRVLYRLPHVLAAVRDGKTVYVVEGEKDVHAIERTGAVATTNPGGAGKWRDEYAAALRGASVIVVADRDDAGRKHAHQVEATLRGIAAAVTVVEAAVGKDASDHLAAGKTLADLVPLAVGVTTPSKLLLLDTPTLLTTAPPPLDWLADGVFARGKLTMVGGREKRGKSLIVFVLSVAMAGGGGEIAGIPVSAGRALVIDAENGKDEIHRRLRATGLQLAHADSLLLAEARGVDLREDLEAIADLIAAFKPDVVVLDSYRALWRGNERDESEVATALDPLRKLAHDTGCAIVLIHHAQKGGDEYRGSTAIGACVDWCVMLDHHPDDPIKTRRRLTNPLSRFAPQRDDRWLSMCSGGDDGPVWLEEAEPFEREHDTPVRDQVEAAIRDFVEHEWGVYRCTGCTDDYTSTPPSWSNADFARAAGRNSKDRTVRQAIDRLAEIGYIHRNGDGGRWQRSDTLFDEDRDDG